MVKVQIWLVAIVLTLSAQAQAGSPSLNDLIAERLSLMKPVAAWKHARDAPVEDKPREAVVLEKAAEQAAAEGLDAGSVGPFFEAQIAAAKDIQWCWIARWEAGTALPPSDPPDLKAEIRPELIRLGGEILAEMRQSLAAGDRLAADPAEFAETVSLECLDPTARDAILTALGRVRLAD